MGVYDRQFASATRMIKKYGGLVAISQTVPGVVNADEPWKSTGATKQTVSNIRAAFFPPSKDTLKRAQIKTDTDIVEHYEEVYIANIPNFEISEKATITKWDGSVWNIKYFDAINPNGEGVILYDLLVTQ